MSMQTTCGCGCGVMTQVTKARKPCQCGCECCARADHQRDEEIAELQHLRRSVDERLEQLER